MSRVKKIMIVSFVLAVGFGLAWPFRRSEPQFAPDAQTEIPSEAVSGQVTSNRRPTSDYPGAVDSTLAADKQIAAQMASTANSGPTTPTRTGFDLENHAALVGQPGVQDSATTAPQRQSRAVPQAAGGATSTSRPAYSTGEVASANIGAWPEEVVHIVRNGDTLEKLAERYLGTTARALELFDLNRDQLVNPHLLPIGGELRIPVPPKSESD